MKALVLVALFCVVRSEIFFQDKFTDGGKFRSAARPVTGLRLHLKKKCFC